MIKVITYGTFDVLHYGHIRLLERAKALGDELIVGVTSEEYPRGNRTISKRSAKESRRFVRSALQTKLSSRNTTGRK